MRFVFCSFYSSYRMALCADVLSCLSISVVTVAGIWSSVGGGVFVNMPPRWQWSVSKPGLLIHKAVIADVHVVKNSSVVTITELSPPPRWLATTQPYSVLAALFLENCPSLPPSCESSKCRVIWSRVNARRHRPPPPRVRFPTHAIRSEWPAVQIALISFMAWSQRPTRLNSTCYDHGCKL